MARNSKKSKNSMRNAQREMIGPELNFAASEAYKLLRTNLEFSIPDEYGCRIVGVTSGLAGEGKSTTSDNLAYSLAEAGWRVLLVEADMRLPTLSERMRGVRRAPGLSNVLVKQCSTGEAVQPSGLLENLHVITAGSVPPNPSELLGSEQMVAFVDSMSKKFDYIVVDLPPVNVVTDALLAGKFIHGMIVVVRQDYATRKSVTDMMRQLRYQDIEVLGFVVTRADGGKKGYYKKGYYKDYYDKAGSGSSRSSSSSKSGTERANNRPVRQKQSASSRPVSSQQMEASEGSGAERRPGRND